MVMPVVFFSLLQEITIPQEDNQLLGAGSCESDSCSNGQEICCHLCKLKVFYHVHKSHYYWTLSWNKWI